MLPNPPARRHGPRQGGVSPTKYSRRAPDARREPSYLYPEPEMQPEGCPTEGRPDEQGKSRSRDSGPRARRGVAGSPGPSMGAARGGGLVCARGAPGPGGRKAKVRTPRPLPRRVQTQRRGDSEGPSPGAAEAPGKCLPAAARPPRASARLAAGRGAGGDSVLWPLARHFPSVRHRCLAPPCLDPAGGAPQCSPTARKIGRAHV